MVCWIKDKRQKEIDLKILNDVLLKTGLSYPESSLLEIVTKMGIEVHVVDFDQEIKGFSFNGGVSGVIYYDKKPRILLNKNNNKERQTFTLAHELGHFILHKPNLSTMFRIDTYNYISTSKESIQETEANYFAASLLVPKDKLLTMMEELEKENVPEWTKISYISIYFGVSDSVIENRLKWLQKNNCPPQKI